MGRRRIGVGFATAVLLGTLAAPAAVASPHVDVIVQFVDGTDNSRGTADAVARQHRASLTFLYEHAIQGFAGSMPANRVEGLRRDPRVAHVEFDQAVSIAEQTVPTGIRRIFADTNEGIGIGTSPEMFVDVDVAVLDTGIATHSDLVIASAVDCTGHTGGPPSRRKNVCVDGGTDKNGHGTHVAGTIAARNNGSGVVGVAPGARLHAVKVLSDNGSGSLSGVIAGIEWVTGKADTISVANMSLGCECTSSAMDTAIAKSVEAGVVYVVAAGNNGKDASTFSPANHPDVITVSALADFNGEPGGGAAPTCRTDTDDTLANFSNYGSHINVAAPGVCILSTVPGGYATYSGTSMAAPHVAGAAALLAASGATGPETIRKTIVDTGNFSWEGSLPGEPILDVSDERKYNPALIANDDDNGNGGGGTDPEPDPEPEPGDFDLSATGYKIRGVHHADLSWSATTSTNVAIYRNGALITTVENTGSYTNNIGNKGGGSYTYKVCEAGTSTCSNEVTVTF